MSYANDMPTVQMVARSDAGLASELRLSVMRLRRRLASERHPDNLLSMCDGGARVPVPQRRPHRRRARLPRAGPAAVHDPHRQLPDEDGYVARRAPGDGRQVLVDLTDSGRETLLADRPAVTRGSPTACASSPRGARVLRQAAPLLVSPRLTDRTTTRKLSPTFRALDNHNYRLYAGRRRVEHRHLDAAGRPRLAGPPALRRHGTALGITTGLQFLPVLLLSPYAGTSPTASPSAGSCGHPDCDGVIARVLGVLAVTGVARCGTSTCSPSSSASARPSTHPARQSFVSEMVGPEDLTNAVGLNSASFNPGRDRGPVAGRLPIVARRRHLGDR